MGARFMIDFQILKDSNRGYIVKRKGGEYEQHAHLTNLEACRRLIKLINLGLLPRNIWMQGSCRRLLNDDEYKRLKRPKDRYYNKSGCNKRT